MQTDRDDAIKQHEWVYLNAFIALMDRYTRYQNSIKFDVKGCSGMESINLEEQSTRVGMTARRRSIVKYERMAEKYRKEEKRARGSQSYLLS